jgi:hypothetical protein
MNNFGDLVDNYFIDLINTVIPVIASLALLSFIWGLAKFIGRVGGDEKAVSEGKSFMIWGIIALFVLVTLWGILGFLSDQFGFAKVFPFLPTP